MSGSGGGARDLVVRGSKCKTPGCVRRVSTAMTALGLCCVKCGKTGGRSHTRPCFDRNAAR